MREEERRQGQEREEMAEEKRESGNRFERAKAMRKAMTMIDMMENTMARATPAFEDFLALPAGAAGAASAVEPDPEVVVVPAPPDVDVDVAADVVVEDEGEEEVVEVVEEESVGMTSREKPLLTSL